MKLSICFFLKIEYIIIVSCVTRNIFVLGLPDVKICSFRSVRKVNREESVCTLFNSLNLLLSEIVGNNFVLCKYQRMNITHLFSKLFKVVCNYISVFSHRYLHRTKLFSYFISTIEWNHQVYRNVLFITYTGIIFLETKQDLKPQSVRMLKHQQAIVTCSYLLVQRFCLQEEVQLRERDVRITVINNMIKLCVI